MIIFDSVLNFFITSAHAEPTSVPAAPAPQGSGFSLVIMIALFLVFMYFMILRPQQKRAKETRNMLSTLAKGDEVVTVGGVLGKIVKISDTLAVLEIANNVEVTVQKSAIASPLPKGTLKSI